MADEYDYAVLCNGTWEAACCLYSHVRVRTSAASVRRLFPTQAFYLRDLVWHYEVFRLLAYEHSNHVATQRSPSAQRRLFFQLSSYHSIRARTYSHAVSDAA